jgi:hypothetical protein
MAFACIVMYVMAAIHWGLDIQVVLTNEKTLKIVQDVASNCIESLRTGGSCSNISVSDIGSGSTTFAGSGYTTTIVRRANYACSLTALLTVNVSTAYLKLLF